MVEASNCYIVVTSPENWARTAERGWSLLGLKSTRRKLAAQFKPGDHVVAYYTGLKQFGALLTVTSDCFEDHERIWGSPNKPNEDYPYRVRTEAEVVLPPEARLDAQPIARRMHYTQKWPAENWTLAFQGNIHAIPAGDFDLIRAEMTSAVLAH